MQDDADNFLDEMYVRHPGLMQAVLRRRAYFAKKREQLGDDYAEWFWQGVKITDITDKFMWMRDNARTHVRLRDDCQ